MAEEFDRDEMAAATDLGDDAVDESLVELDQLVWSLLDDTISPDSFAKLEQRLVEDTQAREVYLRCVELHSDLLSFYDARPLPQESLPSRLKLPDICLENPRGQSNSCSGS